MHIITKCPEAVTNLGILQTIKVIDSFCTKIYLELLPMQNTSHVESLQLSDAVRRVLEGEVTKAIQVFIK